MTKPLTASDVRGRQIVGMFRAKLLGDPEGYNGEDGDYSRVFVALEEGDFLELFDDLKHCPLLLYSRDDVASLEIRPIEQQLASQCKGEVIQDVFTTPQDETVLLLQSNRLLWITSDYETLVCLEDREELRRECPYLVDRLVPYFSDG